MDTIEKLNIGIVGACGRGKSFKAACDAVEGVRIHAVCDVNAIFFLAYPHTFDTFQFYIDNLGQRLIKDLLRSYDILCKRSYDLIDFEY